MNLHFQRDARQDEQLPSNLFARLDHVVAPEPGSDSVLLAFDAVDADWVARMGTQDPRFNLEDPSGLIAAWIAEAANIADGAPRENPFEGAPLYHIEVELPIGTAPFNFPSVPDYQNIGNQESGLEAAWFSLQVSRQPNGGAAASVYPGLFAAPVSAYVRGTMPSVKQGKALSGIFSLGNLPTISTAQLEQILAKGSADYLAVYDVGQGNSNALLKLYKDKGPREALPTLYYDLGAGVYRNQHTTPRNLVFCFTQHPPIVLSHWDADHWAGAYANSIGGKYPALEQTWVAPMQSPGPIHVAFAHDIMSNGGTIYTYAPKSLATIGTAVLKTGQLLKFTVGVGSDRNNTGIVMSIENSDLDPPRSWLLTGDCDYTFFVPHLAPLPPVALVAPHHGATLGRRSTAPSPLSPSTYRRLVYSFGAGNKHGKSNVQHPTMAGMQLHTSSGWQHGAWPTHSPGSCMAGSDVLETEIHGTAGLGGTQLGGCLMGWDSPPPSVTAPCGSTNCNTSPVRS